MVEHWIKEENWVSFCPTGGRNAKPLPAFGGGFGASASWHSAGALLSAPACVSPPFVPPLPKFSSHHTASKKPLFHNIKSMEFLALINKISSLKNFGPQKPNFKYCQIKNFKSYALFK